MALRVAEQAGGGPADPHAVLAHAVRVLRELDVDTLGDPELEAFIDLGFRLEKATAAGLAQAMAAHDQRKAYAASGARSSAAQFAADQDLRRSVVAARIGLGKRLRHLPETAAAWRRALIHELHVRALARLHTPATAEAFARDETMLVSLAVEQRFDRFCGYLDYWWQLHAPDAAANDAETQYQNRNLHHSKTFQGSWEGRWSGDPLGGGAIDNELSRLTKQLWEHDVEEARARLGREPTKDELWRTPAQRRFDALVLMARRSARPDHTTGAEPAPQINVLIDYPTLFGTICELGDGTVIHPRALLPWLDGAYLRRLVFDPKKRVLEVGENTRCYHGAIRDAVLARDRDCFHHYCDQHYDSWYIEIDHIQPHSRGGPTTLANGQLGCSWHNKWKWRTVDQFLDDHAQPDPDPPPVDEP